MPDPIIDRSTDRRPEHDALLAEYGRPRAARGARDARARRARRVRAARHLRHAVRRDRADRRAHARCGAPARQPRAPPRAGAPRHARRRLQVQRSVVEAFLAAGARRRFPQARRRSRSRRSSFGATRATGCVEVRGAEEVARRAQSFSRIGLLRRPVLVNGAAGAVCMLDGKPFSVMAFTVSGGRDRRDRHPPRPRAARPARSDRARRLGAVLLRAGEEVPVRLGFAAARGSSTVVRASRSRYARVRGCSIGTSWSA